MPDITPDLHRFNDPTEITHDVIHGTSKSAYRFIQTQGLSRMNRNHIHFAAGLSHDAKVISGIRQSAEVLIYLDVRKAMQGTTSLSVF